MHRISGVRALPALIILVGAVCLGAAGQIHSVAIEQVDLEFDDGTLLVDSSAGSAVLTYGTGTIQYFNLAVDDEWVVRNVPVVPFSYSSRETVTFWFPLGVAEGRRVDSVSYGASLTSELSLHAPSADSVAQVADRRVTVPLVLNPPSLGWPSFPVFVETGDIALAWASMKRPPRISDCYKNACAPAAFADSIAYLNDLYDLELEPWMYAWNVWADVVRWDEFPKNEGEHISPTWVDDKIAYCNQVGIPVTTRVTYDPADAMLELERGQDVEMGTGKHIAMVSGMIMLADGRFVIYVAHDTDQRESGGTRIEKVIYRPGPDPSQPGKGAALEGAASFNGQTDPYFVIECPTTNTTDQGG